MTVTLNRRLIASLSLFAIFLAYLAATWFTMLAHEPWRDETYAWLIARDTGWGEFWRLRAYDGTPALWYLMLMPLARLGLPYLSLPILHLLLASGIVALILWRSPFPWLTKALLVFSYYLFWQYAIEARLYTVGLLLLFLAANWYGERLGRPLRYAACVALMFNTNVHMAPLAGALLLAYAFECLGSGARTKQALAGLGIMAAGALAMLLQIRPWARLPDAMPSHPHLSLANVQTYEALTALSDSFFAGLLPVELIWYAAAGMLLLGCYVLLSKPLPLAIFVLNTAGLLTIFACVQRGFPRHHGLLLLGFVFCLWIATKHDDWQPRPLRWLPDAAKRTALLLPALNLCLLLSLPQGFAMHGAERSKSYSGGRAMAAFIKANGLDKQVIAAYRTAPAMSLLPYLPGVKFWYAGIAQYGTYVLHNWAHFTTDSGPNAYENALLNVDRAFPPGKPQIVLLDAQLNSIWGNKYLLLHQEDEAEFGSGESFFLYLRN